MKKTKKIGTRLPAKKWCLERCAPGVEHCLCRAKNTMQLHSKKSRNNIINDWLGEHGKPLPNNAFANTTGCVVNIKANV